MKVEIAWWGVSLTPENKKEAKQLKELHKSFTDIDIPLHAELDDAVYFEGDSLFLTRGGC